MTQPTSPSLACLAAGDAMPSTGCSWLGCGPQGQAGPAFWPHSLQGVGGSGEPSPGHPAAPSGSDAVVLGMAVAPGLCLHHCREALSSSPHIWASLPLSRWLCSFCAVVSTCSRGYKAPAHPDPAAVHGGGRFMCPGRERPSPFPTPQCRLLSCT